MEAEVNISLSYKTIKEAEAVARAVSPDNVRVPHGLFVETKRRGRRVLTRIACENGLKRFVATIDDFLSAVSVAERSVFEVMHR